MEKKVERHSYRSICYCIWLFPHFLQDWYDLIKCWPFARVFIHADLDKFCHVGRNTRADVQPQPFRGDPHPGLHRSEVTEGDLPGRHLPQHDGVAPHVGSPGVDVWRTFLQSLKRKLMSRIWYLEGTWQTSGAIHAGWYILPFSWKLNFASAMLTLATSSSSDTQSIWRKIMFVCLTWINYYHDVVTVQIESWQLSV